MNKKLAVSFLLIIFACSFVQVPYVFASVYNSIPVEVGEIYAGNGQGFDPNQLDIYQLDDGERLFAPVTVGGFNIDNYWYVSTDDGLTWGAASGGMRTAQSGISDYAAFSWDGIWDPLTGNFHNSGTLDTTGSNEELWYVHGARADSVITNTKQELHDQGASGGGSTAITVDENGYPILVFSSYNNTAGSPYQQLSVWFGEDTTASPTFVVHSDFLSNIFGFGNTNTALDLHMVAEDTVLVLFGQLAGSYNIYGVYCTRSGGFGAAFSVSQDALVGDVVGVNNQYWGTWDSYSEHTQDPGEYAEEILICYYNTIDELKGELYDVDYAGGDLDLQAGEEKVIEDVSSSYKEPARVGITRDLDTYWVMYMNERDDFSPDFGNFSLAERDWSDGSWDVTDGFMETNQESENFVISRNFVTLNSTLYGFCFNFMDTSPNSQDLYFHEALGSMAPLPNTITVDGEKFNYYNNEDPDFIFVDWKYYDFTLTIMDANLNSTDLDFAFIRFNIPTYEGNVLVAPFYDAGEGAWGLITNVSDPNRAGEPVIFTEGSLAAFSFAGQTGTSYIFELWFNDKCLDVWDPDLAIDVELAWNETDGYSHSWENTQDVFRVYNDGGFPDDVIITGPGSSGVLPGGRDISMFAYNNSYVYKEIVWRDAVHIKLMPTTYFRAGESAWDQIYQIDYVLENGVQHQGLQIKIVPDEVSYTGVFSSNVWINMTVYFYGSDGGLIKEDDLYMFYHGEVYNPPDPGRWNFWIDLWFDSNNASTVIGGRINAYEYPMQDASDAWFRWLSSNWGIMDTYPKQAECFTTIINSAGDPVSAENIKFVVLTSSLNVPGLDSSDQFIAISDFGVYDISLSQQLPMKGISSPPWDETQMPGVGNTGLLGAIFSMFTGLGQWLSENLLFGGLDLWGNFVAFLDSVAAVFGAPTFFSDLFGWIATGLTYLWDSMSYGFEIIANIFLMIGSLIVDFLSIMGEVIASFINTLGIAGDMIGGGIAGASDLWTDLGLSSWITLAIIFYPLYLIVLWEKEGAEPVIQQLTWIFGILVWLGNFFISIAQFVIGLITALIESIPVAE